MFSVYVFLIEFKCVCGHLPGKVVVFGVDTSVVQRILQVGVFRVPCLGWLGKGRLLWYTKETGCVQENLRRQQRSLDELIAVGKVPALKGDQHVV
jgi:hypothetical protein